MFLSVASVIVSFVSAAAVSACRQQNINLYLLRAPAGTYCEISTHMRGLPICFNEHSRATAESNFCPCHWQAPTWHYGSLLKCVFLLVRNKSGKWNLFLGCCCSPPPRPHSAPKRLTRRLLTMGLPGLSLALTRQSTPFMRVWAPSPHRSHLSLWWKVCRYAHSLFCCL